MPKPIALLLLNWNTPIHTSNCILSLLAHCDTSLFDIIVADNGSSDNSLAKLKSQFPELIYIDNKINLGFAEGNNKALQYSIQNKYAYSLIINNDTEVDEDLVKGLFDHLQSYPEVAAVQPAIYWLHNKTKLWNGKGCFTSLTGNVYSDKNTPSLQDVHQKAAWLTGCCMLVRNTVFEKVGLFNSKFFLYYEDVELSFRIREAGMDLHYLPQVKLYHEAGVSGKVSTNEKEGTLSPVIHYYISRNNIWLLRRFGNPLFYPVILLYNTPYYLGVLCYFLLKCRFKKANFLINGIKEGFLTPEKVIWPKIK